VEHGHPVTWILAPPGPESIPSPVMRDFAEQARTPGLVVFVGAGVSMVPPTCLPGWMDFNRVVLEAVADRVGAYVRPRFAEDALQVLLARRITSEFAPDYQAQLIEQECGADYFSLLQALDTDRWNGCHDTIAALAGAGLVRAVVTTNFDTLTEQALAAEGVEHQVHSRPGSFTELRRRLEAGPGPEGERVPVPVVKVHGSVERPDSMVDTLQQRVRGLTEDLGVALRLLFERHHLVVLGFSGADLDYDPGYLQLRAAAAASPGMTFLVRAGEAPRPSVAELAAAYGDKARIASGSLPDWLDEVAGGLGVDRPPRQVPTGAETDRLRAERLAQVAGRAAAWAAELGDMAAINILAALLRGSGNEEGSFRLLQQVWKHYRRSSDCTGPKFGRFCFDVGERLLERGVLRTRDELELMAAVRSGDRDAVARAFHGAPSMMAFSAFQFLGRAEMFDHRAKAQLALVCAYLGETKVALGAAGQALKEAADGEDPRAWTDAIDACTRIYDMIGRWDDGLVILVESAPLVRWNGDEPRRARFNALLGRYLARAGYHEQAETTIKDGLLVAERLGLTAVAAENRAALGFLELQRGRYPAALEHLHAAEGVLRRAGRLPAWLPLVYDIVDTILHIDWTDSPARADASAETVALLRASDDLVEQVPGFFPHHYLAAAWFDWSSFNYERARQSLAEARRFGELYENPWALREADDLAPRLSAS
jgi:SIR2-like domain